MGLLEDFAGQFLDWKTRTRKTIERNARDPAGLLASFAQDVQQGAAADKSAWDASRSVMPGVREAGVREMNARGQELGGLLGTFAGVGAKTADVVKLEQAKKMAKAGADPVEVWKQTGWTDQFPDGKWRFEISDDEALLKGVSNIDKGISKVDALDHPALYAAHPDIQAIPKDIQFGSRVPIRGSYSTDGGEAIKVGGVDPNDALGVALHEGQHAAQRREGFARGGNPETAADPMYAKLNDEMSWLAKQMDRLKEQKYSAEWPTGAWDRQMAELKSAYDAAMEARAKINPYDNYRRLAGEAEARLTQSRMNLTPAERAARPPWLEFDVPREQQIVRGLLGEPTGPAMSVREPTKFQLAHAEAQRNAALPVEQGGLGLGPQNTAMERAKAMGFEGGWAHGTGAGDIAELRPGAIGAEGPGIYATKHLPEASTYAQGDAPTVYPLMVKRAGILDVGKKNPYDVLGAETDEQLLTALKKTGKDSIVKTQDKTPDWLIKAGAPAMPDRQHYVSMNPANFRSRFAAFDPKKRDSRDLLASMGLLGLLGAGAYGQEQ